MFSRRICVFIIVVAFASLCAASGMRAQTPGYVEREVTIPWVLAAPNGLDALQVYFDAPGKHPLLVMTHGSSRKPEENHAVTPWSLLPQALWFARRGWFVIAVVRRGYGRSSGEPDGHRIGPCGSRDYRAAGEASAADLAEVIEYAHALPQVDTSRVMAVGVSTGGFATVALTAKAPAGLVAAISFAGGRGSQSDHDVCDPSSLVSAFKSFGKTSRTPMLWLYAENDKFFWPELAHKFDDAFRSQGGQNEFVLAPAIADDGHTLFRHPDAWSDTVSHWLDQRGLTLLPEIYPEVRAPDVATPEGLGENGAEAFHAYLLLGPHKAFAKSEHGFGYASAKLNTDDARKVALDNCKHSVSDPAACAIVNVDNAPVPH
jgi:dienelactone hydrolase